MGGQFHDLAAGTATPKSYEFAQNDDVIAMNQFAGVLARMLRKPWPRHWILETSGTPVVVLESA